MERDLGYKRLAAWGRGLLWFLCVQPKFHDLHCGGLAAAQPCQQLFAISCVKHQLTLLFDLLLLLLLLLLLPLYASHRSCRTPLLR
jgi:hypothetical protein